MTVELQALVEAITKAQELERICAEAKLAAAPYNEAVNVAYEKLHEARKAVEVAAKPLGFHCTIFSGKP